MKKNMWIVGLLMVSGVALAQEAAAPVAEAHGFTSGNITLWELIVVGGWCMIPLGICSFVGVILVVQNFISLRPKTLLHTEMMPELMEMRVSR